MTDIEHGDITAGHRVYVRGHWWRVLGRHHSFGALRVQFDGEGSPAEFGPLSVEKVFLSEDVEEVWCP